MSTPSIAIRHAQKQDVPAIETLMDALDALHVEHLPWLLQEKTQSHADELSPYIDRPDRTAFVAESSAIVGVVLVYVRELPRAPRLRPGRVAELEALVVSAHHRRRGFGRALVDTAVDWARAAGAQRTELGVYAFNDAALRFWQSVGFAPLSHRLYKD